MRPFNVLTLSLSVAATLLISAPAAAQYKVVIDLETIGASSGPGGAGGGSGGGGGSTPSLSSTESDYLNTYCTVTTQGGSSFGATSGQSIDGSHLVTGTLDTLECNPTGDGNYISSTRTFVDSVGAEDRFGSLSGFGYMYFNSFEGMNILSDTDFEGMTTTTSDFCRSLTNSSSVRTDTAGSGGGLPLAGAEISSSSTGPGGAISIETICGGKIESPFQSEWANFGYENDLTVPGAISDNDWSQFFGSEGSIPWSDGLNWTTVVTNDTDKVSSLPNADYPAQSAMEIDFDQQEITNFGGLTALSSVGTIDDRVDFGNAAIPASINFPLGKASSFQATADSLSSVASLTQTQHKYSLVVDSLDTTAALTEVGSDMFMRGFSDTDLDAFSNLSMVGSTDGHGVIHIRGNNLTDLSGLAGVTVANSSDVPDIWIETQSTITQKLPSDSNICAQPLESFSVSSSESNENFFASTPLSRSEVCQ